MDREAAGYEYLARHKIPDLLHNLSALLLYHRPENPKDFLIKTLEQLKVAKSTDMDYPNLMDESNLDTMFDMLDIAGQGYINMAQYKGALESLGLSSEDVSYEENQPITPVVLKENVMKKFTEIWKAV